MFNYFNLIIALFVYIYHNRIQVKGETEVESEHYNDEYPNYRSSSYESSQCSMEVPCHLLTGPLRTIRALLNELETVSKIHCSKVAEVPDRGILPTVRRKTQIPLRDQNVPRSLKNQKSYYYVPPPHSPMSMSMNYLQRPPMSPYSHRALNHKPNSFHPNNRENTRKSDLNNVIMANPLENDDGRRAKKKVRLCTKKPNRDKSDFKVAHRMDINSKEDSNDETGDTKIASLEKPLKTSSTDLKIDE